MSKERHFLNCFLMFNTIRKGMLKKFYVKPFSFLSNSAKKKKAKSTNPSSARLAPFLGPAPRALLK